MSCTQSCNQGRNCTCRQACELPIDQDNDIPILWRVVNVLLVICLAGSICWLLGVFGPALDAAAAPSDAEIQAQHEYRKELAAAKLCRETHGESLVSWSAAGELVCIPRGYIHRRNQVAFVR
jgi:hypothetical protein